VTRPIRVWVLSFFVAVMEAFGQFNDPVQRFNEITYVLGSVVDEFPIRIPVYPRPLIPPIVTGSRRVEPLTD